MYALWIHICKTIGQSVLAHYTSVHSCTTSHRTRQDRTILPREHGLSKTDLKCLGTSVIDTPDFINSGYCPLLKFEFGYNDFCKILIRFRPARLFVKDGYNMNLVAPDHLSTGLSKGVLSIVFIQLQSDEATDKLKIHLKSSLIHYVFQGQSALYQNLKHKLMQGLTILSLCCLLTTLPSTLEALSFSEKLPPKRLLTNIRRFFSIACRWPALERH